MQLHGCNGRRNHSATSATSRAATRSGSRKRQTVWYERARELVRSTAAKLMSNETHTRTRTRTYTFRAAQKAPIRCTSEASAARLSAPYKIARTWTLCALDRSTGIRAAKGLQLASATCAPVAAVDRCIQNSATCCTRATEQALVAAGSCECKIQCRPGRVGRRSILWHC